MNMISYRPLLLVVIAVPLCATSTTTKKMTYAMGKVTSLPSICGQNVLLSINGCIEVVSTGNAAGNCFVTLEVGLTSKFSCNICMSHDEWTVDNDVVNITLTGEEENIFLKHGQDKLNETCFIGRRLDILVVEDEDYIRKCSAEDKPCSDYSFKFALTPNCFGEPISKCSNTMDGVVVALSISIVIIVVLVFLLVGGRVMVSFLYWKHTQNQSRNTHQQRIADTGTDAEPLTPDN